jgi:serine protease Do
MDARGLRPGELVIAVGHPLGVAYATTLGIVHRAPGSGRGPAGWLQADIRLAPGNSGGPLADASGRIVGINAMIVGGLGLAVPTHIVERFVQDTERARVGVRAA